MSCPCGFFGGALRVRRGLVCDMFVRRLRRAPACPIEPLIAEDHLPESLAVGQGATLQNFKTEPEAEQARDQKAKQLQGDFAYLNFSNDL